jgi:hypothetical protein
MDRSSQKLDGQARLAIARHLRAINEAAGPQEIPAELLEILRLLDDGGKNAASQPATEAGGADSRRVGTDETAGRDSRRGPAPSK